jgi:gamma-glutamylcyclotransferase (GGCT)/AIG2-like uncharacterized protein YtfP
MTPASTYLFIYGTLFPEFAPAEVRPLVKRLKKVGDGSIRGSMYNLGDYPGAVQDNRSHRVFGSVYQVPNLAVLRRLDLYEGFNPLRPTSSTFVRRKVIVRMAEGGHIRSWAYLYNGSIRKATRIDGGVFEPKKKAVYG